jgi:phosphatidyl-myo-inositol alpha-mannosyltransferase
VRVLGGHGDGALLVIALAPLAALLAVALARGLIPALGRSSAAGIGQRSPLVAALIMMLRRLLLRLRDGLRVFRQPRSALAATVAQLGAWALQWLSCWLLLMAFGLDSRVGVGGAAAVLFAVNVTAVVPATPANIGVFQAACVAVLAGAYHVSIPDAIAYGIVLQAVELAAAVLMGVPALVNEGLSWKDVRLRTMHATPVKLPALPESDRTAVHGERLGG